MTNLPYSFFKDRFEFFTRHIDLAVVVPKLRAKRQLTDEEYETVDFIMTPKIKRKRQLADILYGKPPWVPWIVLECLRDASDSSPPDNHVLLADELERYLEEWPGGPQQFMPLTRERSFEKQHSSEEQRVVDPFHALHTTNQQYRNLLRVISSELNQQIFDRERVTQILGVMCSDGNMTLQLPPNVTDFASLMVFLHNRGLCHEYDTDFLCEMLGLIPAPELREEVVAYTNSLGGINVLQCNNMHWSVLPSSDHFVAFTFHALTSMTLKQALGVKDFLAFYLGIPRYSFILRRAEEGSVVLVWQFRGKFLEHFYEKCDGEKLRVILDREEKVETKNIEKVEVQVNGEGERKIVLNRSQGLKRQRSDEVSSTTVSSTTGEEYPAKVMKMDTSEELRRGKGTESQKPPAQESPVSTCNANRQEELINTPYSSGPEVVRLCIEKLKSPEFNMPDDNDFMRRVAYIMSDFGREMSGNGGIWQLSTTAFRDTMDTSAHYSLPRKYRKIWKAYGIDWKNVKYEDLNKPFYSALAARLYLSNFNEPIPPPHKVNEQAEYWKFMYMRGEGDMVMFKLKSLQLMQ